MRKSKKVGKIEKFENIEIDKKEEKDLENPFLNFELVGLEEIFKNVRNEKKEDILKEENPFLRFELKGLEEIFI